MIPSMKLSEEYFSIIVIGFSSKNIGSTLIMRASSDY